MRYHEPFTLPAPARPPAEGLSPITGLGTEDGQTNNGMEHGTDYHGRCTGSLPQVGEGREGSFRQRIPAPPQPQTFGELANSFWTWGKSPLHQGSAAFL